MAGLPSGVHSTEYNPTSARESIRLVIWDLDNTFWKGTLSEGGITEYSRENHEIVIALARRGIISSICSKNDPKTVIPILAEKGILHYFVFPSLSWDSKGSRLQSLIEAVQLRPETVLFIDDNASNRAEAAAFVPGLQIEDETFIRRLLVDPRFKGKDDNSLSRLSQYKLLEQRRSDEAQAGRNSSEFLRTCNIRVYVEYDVLANFGRAIELINRTNQLNFTKARLPEELGEARRVLSELCCKPGYQAGLIRAIDRYGDYGFVGFYMVRNGRDRLSPHLAGQTLVHYCFSCRTLGMLIEKWFYDFLRRPQLDVVGEVLTDLADERPVDWIRLVPSLDGEKLGGETFAPEIRIYGGCEANSVAHYLGPHAERVHVWGNFAVGGLFVRINGAPQLLAASNHCNDPEFEEELGTIGIPPSLVGGAYFSGAPKDSLFLFSGAYDAQVGQYRYRHRDKDWTLKIEVNGFPLDLVKATEAQLQKIETLRLGPQEKSRLFSIARHLRAYYDSVSGLSGADLIQAMIELLSLAPEGARFIIMLDDERVRGPDGGIRVAPWVAPYNREMRALAASIPFVGTASYTACIHAENEILVGGNHYGRMVYCRMAEEMVAIARRLPGKTRDDQLTSGIAGSARQPIELGIM